MPRATFFPTLAALLLLAPCAAAQAPAEVTRIACVGEHSTDSGRVENSLEYPARLQALLGDGYQVAEFGFGTASLTVTQFPTVAYADSPEYGESLAFEPDIVIVGPWGRGDTVGTVHIDDGANDNVYLYEQATPLLAADFQTALESLITAYQALPQHPSVLVALPLPFPYGTGDGHMTDIILPTTQQLAEARNLPTVDLWSAFLDHRDEFEDADHLSPSPGGMQHMAEVMFAAVQAHEAEMGAGGSGGTAGTAGTEGGAGANSVAGVAGASNAGAPPEMPAMGGNAGFGGSAASGAAQDPAPGLGATSPSNAPSGSSSSSSGGCGVGRATTTPPGVLVGCLLALLGIALRRRPRDAHVGAK